MTVIRTVNNTISVLETREEIRKKLLTPPYRQDMPGFISLHEPSTFEPETGVEVFVAVAHIVSIVS